MIEVAAAIIVNGGKILIAQRAENQNLAGKWEFPGGKVESGETPEECLVREIKEETGLTISNLELCGVQNWTDPTDHYLYLVFCYKTSHFSGSIQASDEGEVFWIDRPDLKNVQLADGFETMLEIFEQSQLTENFYWFEDGE